MTTVRPPVVISRISSSTAADDSGSRPEVGSSNSSSSGSCRTERASARRGLHARGVPADQGVESGSDAEALRGIVDPPLLVGAHSVEFCCVVEVVATR